MVNIYVEVESPYDNHLTCFSRHERSHHIYVQDIKQRRSDQEQMNTCHLNC